MSASALKHHDDGGNVTLFGGEDGRMLFACSAGHWWILVADSTGTSPRSTQQLETLKLDFGEEPLRVMNIM